MPVSVRNQCRLLAVFFFLCWQHSASAQLSASFSAVPSRAGCSPLVVNFTDASTGAPTQWRWDLGNGVISLLRNPSTTYFNPGTYAVKLVVRNAAGNADSVTKTDYITVYPNPVADFTADKTTGCFPLPVSFTDKSSTALGSLSSWVWDFGDGNTSTQQNPAHTYSAAGSYTVTLRVTNSSGCSKTITRSQYVTVGNGVTAAFANTQPAACTAPAAVTFTNASTGPGPLAYAWTFGDGGTSTQQNPVHTYAANGTFAVTLAVTSPQGCTDTLRKSNLVNIGQQKAAFTSPDTICAGAMVSFTNTSSPLPQSSAWSFGNGTFSVQQNPSVVYTVSGKYTVKLVSNFGGCVDSVTRDIFVKAKPVPQFVASANVVCSVPSTVSFTNQTAGANNVQWNFGDGGTSTQQNPVHTYTAAGSYTVSLTVINSSGCSETFTKTDFVQIQKPLVSISGFPRSGCAPITVYPSATVTSSHVLTSYLWKFGDGATSTAQSPVHTYSAAGVYTVTLVYTTNTGCTDSVVFPAAVKVGTKPKASFAITPTQACAFMPVSFTDLSTGSVDQWQWSFGDGGTSTLQNPVYQYSDTGWFNVQLIVYNNNCPDTLRLTRAVHINPPIAVFSVQGNCGNKYTKVFKDSSIGATSWFWNFGDGNTSTQQNPVHTYAAAGTYKVVLTVSNDTCSNAMTQTVKVIDEKARFTTDSIVCRNTPISFRGDGINASNVASWIWNFGDGTSSPANKIATHVYAAAGTYNVRLIINDVLGCSDTLTKPVNVYGPTAAFTVSAGVACFNQNTTTFTDQSTGDGLHPILQWQWNYGDGTVDSAGVPPYRHSYAAAGNYTVSLLVKDAYGCTDLRTNAAAVLIVQPKAVFASADTVTCIGKTVAFTNASSGSNLQYAWAFGDGGTASTQQPTHNYTATGVYTVKLLVTDQYGCKDSLTRPGYVSVSYPRAKLAASDSFSTCPPLLVRFSHQSSDYTSLTWNFGDGTSSQLDSPSHFYTAAGVYYATLTVTGPGGCTDVATQRIEIKGPSGSFAYSPLTGCKPLTVNFTGSARNIVSYTWDFADGTIAVTGDSTVSHTYTTAGDYLPRLILTDAGGCSVPIAGPDVIKVVGLTAGFHTGVSSFCNDGTVQFQNTTVGNDFITGYRWSFGDGATSTDQNPSHHYATPGLYTVSLNVISQTGCVDSITFVDTVKVYANPVISISHDSSGCVPVTVRFNGDVLSGDPGKLTWRWDFGNGNTGSQQGSVQVYGTANAYIVTALATDDHGCRDTASVTVNAYPLPVIDAGPDAFICRGAFTQLNASGAATYSWTAAPSLSCTSCASPLAAPLDSTRYFVRGTTAFGCVADDSVTVRVHQPFTLRVEQGDTVCSGSTVHLRASGADAYTWVPSTAVANPAAGITTAAPTVTTNYAVIAKDNANCFTDTGYVFIKVWPYPVVDAGPDRTVNIGSTFVLEPTYSADVTAYKWTNTQQTLSCTTCPAPMVLTRSVQATYGIEVMNAGGCVSKDEVTVYAICNGGNLFIPNTFSPNGDGRNDVFYPSGSGIGKIKSLRVYNRWGELVFNGANFDVNDPAAGWNGNFKGSALPPDVYVYTCEVVCVNNEVLIYNGNLTLLK